MVLVSDKHFCCYKYYSSSLFVLVTLCNVHLLVFLYPADELNIKELTRHDITAIRPIHTKGDDDDDADSAFGTVTSVFSELTQTRVPTEFSQVRIIFFVSLTKIVLLTRSLHELSYFVIYTKAYLFCMYVLS